MYPVAIATIFVVLFLQEGEANEFHNCNDSLPVLLHFGFDDIMRVEVGAPLQIQAGATVKETFPERFRVQHIMERRIFGEWFKLPCIGAQGNGTECYVDMPCENFVKMGFEGTCPIQPGEYRQKIFIPVPDFKVPVFLTAGLYRARVYGYSADMSRMWFCGSFVQYIEQKKKPRPVKKLISLD